MSDWLNQDVPLWSVFVAVLATTIATRLWADIAERIRRKK